MGLALNLHALLQPQGQFIVSPNAPEQSYTPPSLSYKDKVLVRVFGWNAAPVGDAPLTSVDLSPYFVELTVGTRDERPVVGFFSIAFDGGAASIPISVVSSPLQVQTILSTSSVVVTGKPGSYLFTAAAVGVRPAPDVIFSGDLSVTPLVTTIHGGSATTLAQWRVEFPEVAPAAIAFDDWTTQSVVPNSIAEAVANTDATVWRISIDPSVVVGYFRISVGAGTTGLIAFGESAATVQSQIRMLPGGENAQVMDGSRSGCSYIAAFGGTVDVDVLDSGTSIPPSLAGVLDMDTPGVRDLLGDEDNVDVLLTLSVYDPQTGTLVTYAQSPIKLAMPVQRPVDYSDELNTARLSFIDLPDMTTGLWHRITLAGTNEAPTFEIADGVSYVAQQGPIFIADTEGRSCYMLTIYTGLTLQITAVKAQGNPINAAFQPRPLALVSPENAALYCGIEITPPEDPDFAEPATLEIGTPA